jgi:hypothetical protein
MFDDWEPAIPASQWTGRGPWAGSPMDVLRRHVRKALYPSYACEQCVGQEEWQGCYCAYYGAPAPNCGPSRLRHWLRTLADRYLGIGGIR